jgi:hypothetical protein
VYEKPKRTSK